MLSDVGLVQVTQMGANPGCGGMAWPYAQKGRSSTGHWMTQTASNATKRTKTYNMPCWYC